jgi:hypothetical protein
MTALIIVSVMITFFVNSDDGKIATNRVAAINDLISRELKP